MYEVCIKCTKEMMDRIKVYWKDMILTEDNVLFGASTYQLGLQELSLIT